MNDYIVDGHTTKAAGTAAYRSSDPNLGQPPVIAEHDNTSGLRLFISLSPPLIWQMSLLEVGEALHEIVLWMLRLSVFLALCFRGGADESLHAYLALH